MGSPPLTAIIGGGITGVSLGYLLAQKGETALLYERSARLGGLVASFRLGSVRMEKYFHHIFLSDLAVRRVISEVGLEPDLFWRGTPMGFYSEGRIHPFNTGFDLLRFAPLPVIDRFRFGLRILQSGRMHDGLNLDHRTARQWVESWWSPTIYQKFWGPLLRSKFGPSADQISAAWLWGRIYARAGSRSSGKEKLGYLRGGFLRVMEAMADRASSKGLTLRLHTEVHRVERSGHRWKIVTSAGTDEVDRVVFACPSPLIPKLCPELPAREVSAHSGVDYVSILCMPIVMNRPLSDIYWTNVGDETIPFTGVIEQTNFIPKEDYGGKHVAYLFNYLPMNHPWMGESKEVIFKRYESGLRALFPTYRSDQVEQVMIFRDTYANAIYSSPYLSKVPPIRSELPGLFFANTAHIFPHDRNMNYSVVLAERLVKELATS